MGRYCVLPSGSTLRIKPELRDPYIIISGDFNRRPLGDALVALPDIQVLDTPPTGSSVCLDLIAANFKEDIMEVNVIGKLETVDGIESDHSIISVQAQLAHSHQYTKIKISLRHHTSEGEEEFGRLLLQEDWSLCMGKCPSELADMLQARLALFMEKCFPVKVRTIRSTDDP